MRRPRSGIGTELVPLVLILACLAGSLALIVSAHRRVASRPKPSPPAVAVVAPPIPPKPAPVIVAEPVPVPEPEEPEPPPPPTPEDPTPKAVAKLTSAEADQLLEASRADRKAAALEEARKTALLESERWRRRESLVRLQLDTLDTKIRKLETEVDELALERDALEKERDARKALASQNQSRPAQAILPHRGVNGTWRRPIVIECSNGMAILRPQGIGFGLLELASGFGPASNPFVATVAREAIRVQGSHSPDGQTVVPYIFFLVRPDGIRAYYEARGRLEPLGITFGYELADQDWEVDFPDLDDVKTWDGSGPSRPDLPDPLATARRPPSGSPAEDEDFPPWGTSGRGGLPDRTEIPGGEFTWPPRPRASLGGGRVSLGNAGGSGAGSLPGSSGGAGSSPGGSGGGLDGGDPLRGLPGGLSGLATPPAALGRPGGGTPGNSSSGWRGVGPGSGSGLGSGAGNPPSSAVPGELSLGGQPITPLKPGTAPGQPDGSSPGGPKPGRELGGLGSTGSGDPGPVGQVTVSDPSNATSTGSGDAQAQADGSGKDDPANTFVWPTQPKGGARNGASGRVSLPPGGGSTPGDPGSPDQSPPVRHTGPFSRPLAMGLDSVASSSSPASASASVEVDPTQPDGTAPGGATAPAGGQGQSENPAQNQSRSTGSASGVQGSNGGQPNSRMVGQYTGTGNPPSGSPPPPGAAGLGMSGMPSPGGMPPSGSPPESQPGKPPSRSSTPMDPSHPSIVDRRFEIVLVCGPRGVIVQPGGYRVTADALKDRDGLMKKQMVGLVKARRTADPKVILEPRVRFLVQPGGEKTYWTARSQFLLSGLDWPMSTQVADPDHLAIIPSESW